MHGRKPKIPMIVATKKPDDILFWSFGTELSLIIKHLANYRKSGVGWDEYRKKIPDNLLEKWKEAAEECRRHGYLFAYSTGEKIIWHTIVADPKNADPCSVCVKTYQDGSCNGKEVKNGNRVDFVPCWRNV